MVSLKVETSTRLRLYKTVGYITSPPSKVDFSPADPPPRKLLFLFPLREELVRESRYVAQRLERFFPSNDISLAVANIYRDILDYSVQSTFYYPVLPGDPPRILMNVMMARFRNQAFDAIFNLDPELNFQLARVMSVVRTSRRVGLSGPFADELYNIQIQRGPDSRLKRAYAQMLKICDLSHDNLPGKQ